jgi:hypothetical protein
VTGVIDRRVPEESSRIMNHFLPQFTDCASVRQLSSSSWTLWSNDLRRIRKEDGVSAGKHPICIKCWMHHAGPRADQ